MAPNGPIFAQMAPYGLASRKPPKTQDALTRPKSSTRPHESPQLCTQRNTGWNVELHVESWQTALIQRTWFQKGIKMHIFPQIPSGRSIDIFHRVDSNATQAGTLSSTLRLDRPHSFKGLDFKKELRCSYGVLHLWVIIKAAPPPHSLSHTHSLTHTPTHHHHTPHKWYTPPFPLGKCVIVWSRQEYTSPTSHLTSLTSPSPHFTPLHSNCVNHTTPTRYTRYNIIIHHTTPTHHDTSCIIIHHHTSFIIHHHTSYNIIIIIQHHHNHTSYNIIIHHTSSNCVNHTSYNIIIHHHSSYIIQLCESYYTIIHYTRYTI